MSDIKINLCGNIIKMHFFMVIPKFLGFKKSTAFFTGFRIIFFSLNWFSRECEEPL